MHCTTKFLFLLLATLFFMLHAACAGGVYPNYHADFEFSTPEDKTHTKKLNEQKWWQTAAFYQIYPRSFKDSNADGIGDLNGITEQLDQLAILGINATWISPIYTSPMADFGYDISNYTEIDEIFGTMQDFEKLIARAKTLGIRIILDFVPNHTSDESIWFQRSAAKDPEYKDFYIWHPGKIVNGKRQPPTNWVSVFRGSAWEWHEKRQEYYLHQFLKKQPDLNYRNPRVRDAMNNVLRFWLSKGVMGFRIDAVPFAFEISSDAQGNWPDEPRNNGNNDPDDYGYLQHIYTVNQPETLNLVYEWRSVLQEYQKANGGEERVMLTEAYAPIEVIMKYYGNETAEGAQLPFNFLLITDLRNESNAYNYAETINNWLTHMPEGRTANWVLGNHDQNRIGSRLGRDRIDMLNMLIMTLPGASVTYQGEELGMTDVWISWNDTVDPSACNSNPNIYERFSRDPERTPYQWNAERNAGFSTATKTWLPLALDYKKVNWNLERQKSDALSHLQVYMRLIELRQEITFKLGKVEVKALNNAVLAAKRTLMHERIYLTLLNIYDGTETINLKQHFADLPDQLEYVMITGASNATVGELVNTQSVRLWPKEAVVLRTTGKITSTVGYYSYYTNGMAALMPLTSYLIICQLIAYLY